MNKIILCAKFSIHPGKETEFKNIIPQLIEKVKANEPGAEVYDWYFNAEGNICQVLETYTDSDAVLAHMANVGDLLGKLLAISNLEGDIYGTLSAQLQSAIASLPIKNYTLFKGL